MIEFIITNSVSRIVVGKYTSLYHQMVKSMGRAYPRTQLIANIRAALSCDGDYIDEVNIKEPIVNQWKIRKYKVYHYGHWYYALKFMVDTNGNTIAVAQDALYEGDYHNSVMMTKPYESTGRRGVIVSEERLRRIIAKSIKECIRRAFEEANNEIKVYKKKVVDNKGGTWPDSMSDQEIEIQNDFFRRNHVTDDSHILQASLDCLNRELHS